MVFPHIFFLHVLSQYVLLARKHSKGRPHPTHFRYSVSPGRDEGEELFDLRTDPDELENLVHAPTYQEIQQNLKNEILHRVMLQDYPLPPRDLLVIGAH